MVAYSSVAHMGFATLGIFAFNLAGEQGAVLQMINHGATTGALFICVGILYERLHTRELGAAAGIGGKMRIFAGLFGVFGLSSMAFPGTNSFIGEFLVLAGGFKVSIPLIVATVPGVVLAAAYMLRMLQRVAYGGTANPDHSAIADLNLREILTLLPLLAFVLLIGLHPQPYLHVMDATLRHLLEQVHAALPAVTP